MIDSLKKLSMAIVDMIGVVFVFINIILVISNIIRRRGTWTVLMRLQRPTVDNIGSISKHPHERHEWK